MDSNNKTASDIFTEYALSFITHTDNPQCMMNYSAISITAWNLSFETEENRKSGIERLEKRLQAKEITNFGRTEAISKTVNKMIEKKVKEFNEHQFKIAGAQFVDEDGVLKIQVTVAP